MKTKDHKVIYAKINKILGDLTPLKVDCGVLCNCACCKGNENQGMLIFPYEETVLPTIENENGDKMVVCDGMCDRNLRPLACKIFPFFPTVDERGRVFIEKDYRAFRLCPLLTHSDEIIFNPKFFKALKKVGKILSKDEECLNFLQKSTDEIDTYYDFLGE